MKLSELKFDGQDKYEDVNIRICNSLVYINPYIIPKIVDVFDMTYNNELVTFQLYNSYIGYNWRCYMTSDLTFEETIYLEFMRMYVKYYKIYLRKEKLNEIIGS